MDCQLLYMCLRVRLQVGGGELLVVVGSVGAGKSSLLSAVLGEMQLQQVRCAKCRMFRYLCS